MVRKKLDSTNTESPLRLEDVIGLQSTSGLLKISSFLFPFSFKVSFLRRKRGKIICGKHENIVRTDSSLSGVQKQLFASGRTKAISCAEVGMACIQT